MEVRTYFINDGHDSAMSDGGNRLSRHPRHGLFVMACLLVPDLCHNPDVRLCLWSVIRQCNDHSLFQCEPLE